METEKAIAPKPIRRYSHLVGGVGESPPPEKKLSLVSSSPLPSPNKGKTTFSKFPLPTERDFQRELDCEFSDDYAKSEILSILNRTDSTFFSSTIFLLEEETKSNEIRISLPERPVNPIYNEEVDDFKIFKFKSSLL